jgi:glutamate 5-kinase
MAGRRSTWFLTASDPVRARKRWIGGTLDTHGAIIVDDGALAALKAGKSLLPAGVRAVEGGFSRGDAVVVRGADGTEIGRGLSGYDHGEAALIIGRNSRDIAGLLGYAGRAAMIHRDDLVLIGEGSET